MKFGVYPNLTLTNRFLQQQKMGKGPPLKKNNYPPKKKFKYFAQVEYLNFKHFDPQDPSLKKRPSYKMTKQYLFELNTKAKHNLSLHKCVHYIYISKQTQLSSIALLTC